MGDVRLVLSKTSVATLQIACNRASKSILPKCAAARRSIQWV
jgi:hypothetical protein